MCGVRRSTARAFLAPHGLTLDDARERRRGCYAEQIGNAPRGHRFLIPPTPHGVGQPLCGHLGARWTRSRWYGRQRVFSQSIGPRLPRLGDQPFPLSFNSPLFAARQAAQMLEDLEADMDDIAGRPPLSHDEFLSGDILSSGAPGTSENGFLSRSSSLSKPGPSFGRAASMKASAAHSSLPPSSAGSRRGSAASGPGGPEQLSRRPSLNSKSFAAGGLARSSSGMSSLEAALLRVDGPSGPGRSYPGSGSALGPPMGKPAAAAPADRDSVPLDLPPGTTAPQLQSPGVALRKTLGRSSSILNHIKN